MRRRGRLRSAALAGFAALVTGWPADALAQGCAMCRTAFEGQTDPLTQAFNTSGIFLMVTPYTVVAAAGVGIYFATRRRAPDENDEAPENGLFRSTEKETTP